MNKTRNNARWLVESAVMIAIGTVLSNPPFKIDFPLGGGLTLCSMLPLVLISWRYGAGRGLIAGAAYSLIQLAFGLDNVQYAASALMGAGIVLLDYIVPYTVLGLAGVFRGRLKDPRLGLALGIAVTFTLRFLCHFLTGWWIWDALWPNEFGWAAPIYSIAYNGSYMAAELVLTCVAAWILYSTPLKRFLNGEDLK